MAATPPPTELEPRRGRPHPLGATLTPEGVNFSVWARTASAVDLLLYDDADSAEPSRVVPLDPRLNKAHAYWHVLVPGLRSGQVYAWRVDGPYLPEQGLYHDKSAVLLDPYAVAVAEPADSTLPRRSVVVDLTAYDWEGDAPLARTYARTVIYEMHVKGFTANPNSGVDERLRGTYLGLIEKISYLQELGVTAVELLPVQAFDPRNTPHGLPNYWGYDPVSFFAPHPGYATTPEPLAVLDEFRDMVKALHRAGIEVILDVVFNHTAERGPDLPPFSWRGFDNETYYLLDQHDRSRYADYSGCGNTMHANHSVVRRMIVDALHFWVAEMHVDGFRFDLASILSRDVDGNPMANPPVLWEIENDPVLAGTKLIAEAWDAAGLYQVGTFVGERWREWNGKFRDDVRRFVRGDRGVVPSLPDRVLASPDMYGRRPAEVEHSVNFVTAHDGFTLNDLVTYSRKRNEANLEGNRDGSDHEHSWNCGVEGPTDDPAVELLRNRQIKNMLAITLISFGVPMLHMGDEVRRTQRGNNNVYCQDNELSWFDWSDVDKHADVLRFVQGLIRLRHSFDVSKLDHGLTLREFLAHSDVRLHGVRLNRPDFGHYSHSLALTVSSLVGTRVAHAILNAYWRPLRFDLPPVQHPWRRIVDTAQESPDDIVSLDAAPYVTTGAYRAQPRSVVVLIAAP